MKKDGYDFDELFPGRFLKAGLFQGADVTLTIKVVRLEELPGDKDKKKKSVIMAFQERDRELVLNKTNASAVKAMFGRNTAEWIGRKVTFYPADLDGELCIRVRGSPELKEKLSFVAQIGLTKKNFTMQPTKLKSVPQKTTNGPPHDPVTGEIPVSAEEAEEIRRLEAESMGQVEPGSGANG